MRRPPDQTPLMRQFLDIKADYPEGILFFRMGDFYEMFFEDAVIAARALDLTLTSRDKGRDDAIPMCGVPHHAMRGYVSRLAEMGHKVVICDQLEDPKAAKGIVKRGVTRIVTPGIFVDDEHLDARSARYVAAVLPGANEAFGLGYLDVTTGEFRAVDVTSPAALGDELARVDPRELLVPVGGCEIVVPIAQRRKLPCSEVDAPDASAADELLVAALGSPLADLGIDRAALSTRAAAMALAYARRTQPAGALPVARLVAYQAEDTLVLDESSRGHLEIVASQMERKKQGSLLGVLDRSKTAPGGRLLKHWLLYPSTDVATVRRRQDAVQFLVERAQVRAALRSELSHVADLERLAGRCTLGVATPRDLGAIRATLAHLPAVFSVLADALAGELDAPSLLQVPAELARSLADISAELARTLVDEPPTSLADGKIVRTGYRADIDEQRTLAGGARDAILAIEKRERERTGIPSLKVRYNRVFGYYLEVTKLHLDSVPDDYVRKQTLANAERYVTEELAGLEAKVLGAEERLKELERQVFESLRERVAARAVSLPAGGRARGDPGRRGDPRRRRPEPRLRAAPGRRLADHRHRGRPSSRGRAVRRPRALRAERLSARSRSGPPVDPDGAQHGGQVDLHAAGRAHRPSGPGGLVRAGAAGTHRRRRPYLHSRRRRRQPGPR